MMFRHQPGNHVLEALKWCSASAGVSWHHIAQHGMDVLSESMGSDA